jgi:hypothetical protein
MVREAVQSPHARNQHQVRWPVAVQNVA